MDMAQVVIDISIIAIFLVIGSVLRAKIKFFQRFVIPSSVIGGLIGLILGGNVLGWLPTSELFPKYANALIDVLFAGLFIGRKIPRVGLLAKTAGAQAAFAYFNAFGQIAIGLAVVIVFGAIGVALHPTFATQLIIGYQGGPGVATAVAPMIGKLGWSAEEAAAVGETCAIAGLLLAILIGVILANIGIVRNLTVKKYHEKGQRVESQTFLNRDSRGIIGMEITSPESANSLAFNLGFMGMAILIGKLIVLGIVTAAPLLKFLPSFPFVLVGGIIVQALLQKFKWDEYVDRGSVESLSFLALDVLIVAALISINLAAVATFAAPLVVLITAGLLFNLWQVMWLGPRILPGAWFEKSLCEFGQNTGSVPQALILLRMTDPRLETDAAEALALKMFLFSPIVTPSTMIVMPLLVKKGPLFFLIIYGALMLLVLGLCRLFTWQKRPKIKWFGKAE